MEEVPPTFQKYLRKQTFFLEHFPNTKIGKREFCFKTIFRQIQVFVADFFLKREKERKITKRWSNTDQKKHNVWTPHKITKIWQSYRNFFLPFRNSDNRCNSVIWR